MPRKLKTHEKGNTLQSLIERTDKENPSHDDVAALRKILDSDEGMALIVARNDPTMKVIDAFIRAESPSVLNQELANRNIKRRQCEMNYSDENAMVQMMINHVILCELRLSQLEMVHGNRTNEPHTFESGEYYDKRLAMAQRRFLRACESLAKVRRLLSEAQHFDAKTRNKRSQSTLASQKILQNATR